MGPRGTYFPQLAASNELASPNLQAGSLPRSAGLAR